MLCQKISFKVFCVLVTVAFATSVLKAANFQGLGDLPGGDFSSLASAVSDDGLAVAGKSTSASGTEAFRWTESSGMMGLGDLPGGSFDSKAQGISSGGLVVVGESRGASDLEAFSWNEGGGMTSLGDLPGGDVKSVARGISADGTVVVGGSSSTLSRLGGGISEAFRWTAGGGMVGLGDLPGGLFDSYATDVSSDGMVVVGSGEAASGPEAFRWTEGGGMVGLGDLPGGDDSSTAQAVSSDGSVVVGWSLSGVANASEAFRWTESGGMVGLGDLPGGILNSVAYATSSHGSVVVGSSVTDVGPEAFIWDDTNGMRKLTDVLTLAGVDLTGWQLLSALDITPDGQTIVGWGLNPSGDTEGWIANLASVPEPSALALLGVGTCIIVARRRK